MKPARHHLPKPVQDLINAALAEDLGSGDVTSRVLVPAGAVSEARIVSKGTFVVCGTLIAEAVFKTVDRRLKVTVVTRDSNTAGKGATILRVKGPARSILAAERTVLNFIQRLTGIATLTREFTAKVRRHRTLILDTRKTTPGMRTLEKYAVKCGGGTNHRMGLHDMVLIKDNHKRFWEKYTGLGLAKAVATARKKAPGVRVEVEVETSAEMRDAIRARPDWIMLDNMSVREMKRCVKQNRGRCLLEASGGIGMRNVLGVAATGVDAISLGCLTHSAPAADLSLEMAE